MGIIGNNSNVNFGVHRAIGDVASMTPGNRSRYSSFCNTRSQSGASTVIAGMASPQGGYPPDTFFPPQTVGEMALRATGSGDLTGNLYPSRNMVVDFTGSGTLTAAGSLIVSMIAALTGSGTLTASIGGVIDASVDFTGSGTLDADMVALGNMVVALLGSGDLDATISAFGDMSLDIVVTGAGLTIENVAQAVWNALATDFNAVGTMGEKLNDAGSAGNPWAALLADNVDPDTFGEFVQKLLTVGKFLGLK